EHDAAPAVAQLAVHVETCNDFGHSSRISRAHGHHRGAEELTTGSNNLRCDADESSHGKDFDGGNALYGFSSEGTLRMSDDCYRTIATNVEALAFEDLQTEKLSQSDAWHRLGW